MKRKLASIRKVLDINAISGADRIEICSIDGWECVTKKGDLIKDRLCLYLEIDSFIPYEERYSFLGKTKEFEGNPGYRIKTIRLKKQISQGLALPLSMFPELANSKLGDDVTELLGVKKYEVPIKQQNGPQSNNPNKKFPSCLCKTNEERIQNLPSYFARYKDMEFEETKKLDGSSCTMYKVKRELKWYEKLSKFLGFRVHEEHFGVCSRNLEIKRSDKYETTFDNGGVSSTYKQSDFWEVAKKYNVQEKLPVGYAIQGELIGPRIQNNHEKVSELEFYIFHVWDIENQKYLTPKARDNIMNLILRDIPHVPIVNKSVKIFSECETVKDLLARVEDVSMNPGTISEGRVYKSLTNSTITFKCISNRYLIRSEK